MMISSIAQKILADIMEQILIHFIYLSHVKSPENLLFRLAIGQKSLKQTDNENENQNLMCF